MTWEHNAKKIMSAGLMRRGKFSRQAQDDEDVEKRKRNFPEISSKMFTHATYASMLNEVLLVRREPSISLVRLLFHLGSLGYLIKKQSHRVFVLGMKGTIHARDGSQ